MKYKKRKQKRLQLAIMAVASIAVLVYAGTRFKKFTTTISTVIEDVEIELETLATTSSIVPDSNADTNYLKTTESVNVDFVKAKLIRVVDGDTLVVSIDGTEYKIRLIGINTPESVASDEYLERTSQENCEEGVQASEYVKNLLSNTQYVYLEKDTSETDVYGRLLRYVWLENVSEITKETIEKYMLNAILVKEGYAEVKAYEPDTKYISIFESF